MPTENKLKGVRIGYALAGSFCTFVKSFKAAEKLRDMGAELLPIMSYNASGVDTRFGKAKDNIGRFEEITGRKVIKTIEDAEPIGPKRMCDVMVVAPCTANSAAKLAVGITDTPLTMAVKSHLRSGLPVVVAISTNDALGACAKNIGILQNYRNYYFVPYAQDDIVKKPASMVADLSLLPETVEMALKGVQIQPVVFNSQFTIHNS